MNSNTDAPLVSVIIVNFNGLKWNAQCLESINRQTYKNIEIIFVDNASTDNSLRTVIEKYPNCKFIKNSKNKGFAGGNNDGYRIAKGEYIYLLNNDTVLSEGCIENLVKSLVNNPRFGAVQSKMLLLNDPSNLDVVGAFWTKTGFLYYYGAGASAEEPKFNAALPVYSNKGASMMIRRGAIDIVGLFDEDFWCYYEEGDLCARLWIAGYECWYEPSAVMKHAGGGTALTFDNSFIQYHNFKNKLASFIKCHQINTLLKILPIYLTLTIIISFVWLMKGKYKHFISLYRALLWNIVHLAQTLKKRRKVQSLRKKTDKQIFSIVQRDPGLAYFKYLMFGGNWVYED